MLVNWSDSCQFIVDLYQSKSMILQTSQIHMYGERQKWDIWLRIAWWGTSHGQFSPHFLVIQTITKIGKSYSPFNESVCANSQWQSWDNNMNLSLGSIGWWRCLWFSWITKANLHWTSAHTYHNLAACWRLAVYTGKWLIHIKQFTTRCYPIIWAERRFQNRISVKNGPGAKS